MKKRAFLLFMLHLNLVLNTFTLFASDQIVISADGKIQQTTESSKKKPISEGRQNSKSKKKKNGSQKALAPAHAKAVQPTIATTPDIIFSPDTLGKTFRLHIQTKLSPASAIITAHDGFFLVMDKKYTIQLPNLAPKNISFIKSITTINDPNVLILRFILEPHIGVNLEHKEKNTYLNFFYRDAASTFTQAPTPALLSLEEKEWPNIVVKPFLTGGSSARITIENNSYYVYMTTKPDGGYQHLYQTPYFKTALTQQGFAIHNFSNKTHFGIKDNQLHITHPATAIKLTTPQNSKHFQNIFDIHPKRDLARERSQLMEDKNKLNGPYSAQKQLHWAWTNIALNLGQDAKTNLKTTAIQYPKIIHQPLYKALLGMSHFLTHEYKDALNCWQTLPNTLEIAIWKQLAASALGHGKGIEQLIFNIKLICEHYPTPLQEVLIAHSLKTAENLHNFSAIYLLLGIDRKDHSLSFKWIKDLYKAKSFYEKNDFRSSNSVIKHMKLEEYPDKTNAELLTETDFLRILNNLNQKDQTEAEAITDLASLRLKWRGGSLEYRISQKLIQLLNNEKQYSEALSHLSGLKRLFPNRSDVELIDVYLQSMYIKYFKNTKGVSPLKIIKTYSEFLEFIPDGQPGEDIIKTVVEQFEKIDLLDEAAELLSRNLAKKADSPEKIETLFRIIDIHLRNHQFDAALAVISTFPHEVATIEQKSKLIIRQAQALLENKKSAEALTLLNASTAAEHGMLAAKIYAQNKKWHEAAEKLSSTLYLIDQKKNPKQLIHLLNDLAIMYSMDNQTEKLKEIGITYKELMKGQTNFEFLTRPNNSDIKQREQAEATLADLTNITDYVKRELELSSKKQLTTK